MWLDRILLLGLASLLVLAPLPFGSVEAIPAAVLAAGCFLLAATWSAWRARRGLASLPWRDPILVFGVLFALFGALQAMPLPWSALEALSPRAAALRAEYETPPPTGAQAIEPGTRGAWRPISLDARATWQAAMRVLAFALVVLIVVDLASAGASWKALAAALAASGGFQAIYGLAEAWSGRQRIFGYVKEYSTDSATGTFINRNHFAGYLEMTLPLALAFAAMAFERLRAARRGPARPASSRDRAIFAGSGVLLLALLMATALVASRSRMGLLSALVSLSSVGLLLAWRGRGRGFMAAVVVVMGVTVVLFAQAGGAPVLDRFLLAADDVQRGWGRWSIWTQALGVVADFPWVGTGLGAFEHVFPLYRTTGEGMAVAHAHNDFIEMAAECGLVGCGIVLAGAVAAIAPLVRRREERPGYGHLGYAAVAGILAMALHSITDFNMAIPSNALTLAALAGMAVSWKRRPSPVLVVDRAPRRGWRARASGSAILLLGLAGAAAVPAVSVLAGTSTSWIDTADPDRLFGIASREGASALSDLDTLMRAGEVDAAPSPEALAYVSKRLNRALSVQAEGTRRLPTAARGHLLRGEILAGLCGVESLASGKEEDCAVRAAPELRAAFRLNPMSAAVAARAARFYIGAWPALDAGTRAEARAVVERAAALNPTDEDLRKRWETIRGQPGTGP